MANINSGYTCSRCGMWVPSGTYHYCTTTSLDRLSAAMERAASALERLSSVLEEIAKQQGEK